MRKLIRFFENISVSDDATASTKAMLGDQRQVRIHRVADRRKHAALGNYQVARNASGFRELDPLFDAAGRAGLAIMIDDALAPSAPELGRFAASEDQSVFDGDGFLIVVAIEGPGLELAARQLSLVHQLMKRMLVVIALFADRP